MCVCGCTVHTVCMQAVAYRVRSDSVYSLYTLCYDLCIYHEQYVNMLIY